MPASASMDTHVHVKGRVSCVIRTAVLLDSEAVRNQHHSPSQKLTGPHTADWTLSSLR